MSELNEILVTKTFYDLYDSKARYNLFVGSTRSGKSIAIIQNLIIKLRDCTNIRIIISSKTLSEAKKKLIPEFEEWLRKMGVYQGLDINKTEFKYRNPYNNSIIEFVMCDDIGKWHGLKADVYWFNEANYVEKNFFEQAEMRLPDREDFNCQMILDYNPTTPHSWVRELELTSDKPGGLEVFHSTFRDNHFLGEKQIKLIESWEHTNKNKWLIYGLGQYGQTRGQIYTNWSTINEWPEELTTYWYGLDFGYTNDPSALIKIGLMGGELYMEENMYETHLTNKDISNKFGFIGVENTDEIFADSAEPKSIEEIYRLGWNILPAKKGKDSVVNGIDILQSYKMNIVKTSHNLINELTNYTWKEDKNGNFLNVPVDDWNHLLDAARYVGLIKLGHNIQGPSRYRTRTIGGNKNIKR